MADRRIDTLARGLAARDSSRRRLARMLAGSAVALHLGWGRLGAGAKKKKRKRQECEACPPPPPPPPPQLATAFCIGKDYFNGAADCQASGPLCDCVVVDDGGTNVSVCGIRLMDASCVNCPAGSRCFNVLSGGLGLRCIRPCPDPIYDPI